MSADTLRFAATTMQLEARHKDVPNKVFLEAVADWLNRVGAEGSAEAWDSALAVARAYLGGDA